MAPRSALQSVLDAFERHYGPVAPPPVRGPFEMILWENIAYLAGDERRGEAFRALRRKIGTTAGAILAAGRWPMALPVDAMQIVIYITDQSVIYMHHHT